MTKSQRRVVGQESKAKTKKTGLKCEECDGEVVRSGIVYICEKCGLTQDRENLSRWKSSVFFNANKCNSCGRSLHSEEEKQTQLCSRCRRKDGV